MRFDPRGRDSGGGKARLVKNKMADKHKNSQLPRGNTVVTCCTLCRSVIFRSESDSLVSCYRQGRLLILLRAAISNFHHVLSSSGVLC